MDGAGFLNRFFYLILPHLARAITVVILIQTIFLLGVYAEILVTTGGGPGYASTNLPFLIYKIGSWAATSAAPRPAASSRSSSPTSSRSS